MPLEKFIPYLIVMAGVTYLVRVIPFILMRKKIKNKFIKSFLYYVPYTVLAAMTFPGILFATNHVLTAAMGLIGAIITASKTKSLLIVAIVTCLAVLIGELGYIAFGTDSLVGLIYR